MSVSVDDVVNDPSPAALNQRDGTYIATQAIEVMVKAVWPLASAMLLHADGRNLATVLMTLDPETLAQCGGLHSPSASACVDCCGDVLNGRLIRWETIKELRILDHDLAVDDGALTPSLKVRRKVTESRSRPLLDSMYDGQRHG